MYKTLRKYPFRFLFLVWLVYLFIPIKEFASLSLTTEDTKGRPVMRGVSADFLDAQGNILTTLRDPWKLINYDGSPIAWMGWGYNDVDKNRSRANPRDAQQVVAVVVRAEGCIAQKLPVQLKSSYQYPWLNEHGGGGASWFYEFKQTVKLDCRPE